MFFSKSLLYYQKYIDCWSGINLNAQKSAILTKQLTICLLVFQSAHCYFLHLYPTLSPYNKLLQFDFFTLVLPGSRLNFIFGSLFSMAALICRDLYFHPNYQLINFLECLLFKSNLDYYFIWWRRGNTSVTQPIKRLAVVVVNALQVFPAIERILLLYGHLLIVLKFKHLIVNSCLLSIWAPLHIVVYTSNSLAFTLALKYFSLNLIQTATIGLTVTYAFFLSFNQCHTYALSAKRDAQYHLLRRYFIQAVTTFLASNRLLSKLFVTFLVFNM